MGLLSRLAYEIGLGIGRVKSEQPQAATEQRYNIENPQIALTGGVMTMVGYGGPTAPTPFGVVTPEIALNFSAYHCGVRVIAETLASLPLIVYRRTKDGKERATDHPLYPILHDRANDIMTSFVWREVLAASAINRGDSFTYIERNRMGQVIALLPLQSHNVKIGLIEGRKFYLVKTGDTGTGPVEEVPNEDMLHVMCETYDGVRGVGIVTYARNTIGLALGAEHHGMQFFAQGASPSGVLEYPRALSDKARLSLKQSWEQAYGGIKGAHKVPILEEGLHFTPISITNEDSQWLASRTFQVQEIARWFRIPAHMLGELSRSTNNNIEQQSLEFAQHTIRPWAERLESELESKLLDPAERQEYFIEFLLEGLVRADLKTRMSAYATGRQWGIYSANDCRDMENLNRVDGGDIYLTPVNMADVKNLLHPPVDPQEEADTQDLSEEGRAEPEQKLLPLLASVDRIVESASIALADSLGRMLTKETQARSRQSFSPDDFYQKHEQVFSSAIGPALQALAGTIAAVRASDPAKASEAATLVADVESRRHCKERPETYDPAQLAKAVAGKLADLLR